MSGSISRSSRDAILLTAFTIVLGLHAVEGGGARRAPAPSEAGDLAAGRDMVSASTALYERCGSAAICGCLAQVGLQLVAREQLRAAGSCERPETLASRAAIPCGRAAAIQPVQGICFSAASLPKLLIRFAHRTPLARSEDSSGSARRRLSIHAVDCTGLLPCCGTCAERRRPALATASNYAFIVLRVANDAAERCKQLAFCSGSISAAVAFILRVSPTPPRSGASYNICSGKPAAECSLHAAGCQRCASPS